MSENLFSNSVSGAAAVAGVAGSPIRHSLSPRLHGAWIAAAGLDAVYAPLAIAEDRFSEAVLGLRAAGFRGLNVTLPFKGEALRIADRTDPTARSAGAANLLLFHPDGEIEARNTDGIGLLYAFARQAPGWSAALGPITVLGAGGGARGAVAALTEAGATDIRVLNRTLNRAEAIARDLPCRAFDWSRAEEAFDGAATLINATSGALTAAGSLPLPRLAPPGPSFAMDMVYTPLRTDFLAGAAKRGFHSVDGLDMLIGQGRPSFEALFGAKVPDQVDVRVLLLEALGRRATGAGV